MVKKIFFVICCSLFLSSVCNAETIYLKNGTKVEGKIVEQTERLIRVDISGVVLTYYLDDVKGIEGAPDPVIRTNMPDQLMAPPQATSPQTSPGVSIEDKKELVLLYLQVSGTREGLDKMFQQAMSETPEPDASRLRQAYDLNEILEILVPIYGKYFSEDDLRTLITFYQSSAAKKVSRVAPQIMQESLEASAKYFQAKIPPADPR